MVIMLSVGSVKEERILSMGKAINYIKSMFGAQDMTIGSPMTNMLKFAIPMLLGNIAQQLYSTVDSIVVGRYVGDAALSAIGASGPIHHMMITVFIAISTGIGVMVAQYFGAKDRENLSHTIGNAMTLIFLGSLFIMLLGILFTDELLTILKTPEETYDMAYDYLIILIVGIAGTGFYNVLSGILRGLGESVFPLLVLLLTTVINTVLDVWFVAGLHWGVAGAAVATVIAQFISAIILIIRTVRLKAVLSIDKSSFKLKKKLVKQMANLGLPAAVMSAIMSLSSVFTQSLQNQMGYRIVACCTAVMRVDGFAMLPNMTFGMAASTFIGQNIGANKKERLRPGFHAALIISMVTSFIIVSCLLFFGKNLVALFTETEEIISLANRMLRILAVGYVAMGINQVCGGVMRGAGDTMSSMWITIITTVIIRVPLAYILAYFTRSEQYPNGSPDALYISMLVSWVLGALMAYGRYRQGKWKDKAVVKYDESGVKEGV